MHKLIYNHLYAKVSVIIVILPCTLKLYIRTEKCICSILVSIVYFLPRLHVPVGAVRWIRLQVFVRFFWHRLCLLAISWVFTFAIFIQTSWEVTTYLYGDLAEIARQPWKYHAVTVWFLWQSWGARTEPVGSVYCLCDNPEGVTRFCFGIMST